MEVNALDIIINSKIGTYRIAAMDQLINSYDYKRLN